MALKRETVPSAVIRRLPRYHRFLGEMLKKGKLRTSSSELSACMGVTSSQIRQDLNCFGGFGQQGYGYNVKYLYDSISDLLGVDEHFSVVVVGAGNLGRALVFSHMFEHRGITKLAMFDVKDSLVGTQINGIPVYHIDSLLSFCQEQKVDIGVLTTPKDAAPEAAELLAKAGVLGIWNFSNMEISLPSYDVEIENMHMGDSLMALCYGLKTRKLLESDDQ
ncbi:MAG: redox-sensing transcriptional repressor Rex [Clostridia bacterium]|nr:redox-sensing transcriptional repressor Rex [Clostridia bacterium]